MIRVGDKRAEIPKIEGVAIRKPMPCRVIYVHPKHRFYTVEFDFPRERAIRESFFLPRSRAES